MIETNKLPNQIKTAEQSVLTNLASNADEKTKKMIESLQSASKELLPSFEYPDEVCDKLLLALGSAMTGTDGTWDNVDCANATYLFRNLCKVIKALHPLIRTDEILK